MKSDRSNNSVRGGLFLVYYGGKWKYFGDKKGRSSAEQTGRHPLYTKRRRIMDFWRKQEDVEAEKPHDKISLFVLQLGFLDSSDVIEVAQ